MTRENETVTTFEGKRSVWEVFMMFIPVGNVNPCTGHEVRIKIKKGNRMLCKNYGAMVEDTFDGLIVKKMKQRPDEIILCV